MEVIGTKVLSFFPPCYSQDYEQKLYVHEFGFRIPYLVNEYGAGRVEVRHLEEKPHQALRFPPELVVPIGRNFGRLSQKS